MEHNTYPMIDAHCDTLCELWKKGGSLRESDCVVSFDRVPQKTGYCQFFAVWLDDEIPTPYKDARQMIDLFHAQLACHENEMLHIKEAADFEKTFREKKLGAMLTVENGRALEGEVSKLLLFHMLGVRAVTLTWNDENELASGVKAKVDHGLTAFGREVILEMNRIGMMVDVSHLSDRSFWDAVAVSKSPVMASHSNSRAVAGHPRNLTDEQIRAIAEQGGMIGLNLYPAFLTEDKTASLTDCVRHIEHIVRVGGENCIGLGSDFDGFGGPKPQGLACANDYPNLFDALRETGCSEAFIQKLAYENWMQYAQKTLKMKFF